MRRDFISAIKEDQGAFGLAISDKAIERLADFYEIVLEQNTLLHLVAPCQPGEFAVRHVLESLKLLEYLPLNARFADIGPGAGLPSIPCLIVREDLHARLIESKEKKVRYLVEAAERLGLSARVDIINRQFEETEPADAEIVTCRALDRFINKLPKLLKWSRGRALVLFGGPSLREALTSSGRSFIEHLMPMSEQRYLFRVSESADRRRA